MNRHPILTVGMKYASRARNIALLVLCCTIQLFVSAAAWAYDANSTVNFNVTGTIEEPSCEVSIKPSENIDLGTIVLIQ